MSVRAKGVERILMNTEPEYPITVVYADGQRWCLESREDAETSLEWFDSEDPEEGARVFDARRRPVHLVVERLQLKVCAIKPAVGTQS